MFKHKNINFNKDDLSQNEISIPEELKISIDSYGGIPHNTEISSSSNKDTQNKHNSYKKIVIPKIENYNEKIKYQISPITLPNEKNLKDSTFLNKNEMENKKLPLQTENCTNSILEKTAAFLPLQTENCTNSILDKTAAFFEKRNSPVNKAKEIKPLNLKNKTIENEIHQGCTTTREIKDVKNIISSKYQLIKNDSNKTKVAKLSNKIDSNPIKPSQLTIKIPQRKEVTQPLQQDNASSVVNVSIAKNAKGDTEKTECREVKENKKLNTDRGVSAKQIQSKNPLISNSKGKDVNLQFDSVIKAFNNDSLSNQPHIVEKLDILIDNLVEIKNVIRKNSKKNIVRSKSGFINTKKSSPNSSATSMSKYSKASNPLSSKK